MPSPFPGMDPYLEISGDWRDFHATFIAGCSNVLNDLLPDRYLARIDERFRMVEVPNDREESRGPDVEEVRETWIKIRREPDWDLVTSIELLSPTNKAEPGFSEYLVKRADVIAQPVHLIELDLLVGGRRLPMDDPLPPGDYYALVSRAGERPESEAFAWSVRRALPVIPVPLSPPDSDILLNLSEVFATTFQRGRYERSIDYGAPLNLPLAPEDRAWAEETARTAIA